MISSAVKYVIQVIPTCCKFIYLYISEFHAAGHKAVFECEVEDKAKVLWLKDNKPLEDKLADRISAVSHNDTKHRLQILGAHECDTGTYTARATNDEGGISSCTAHLLVETCKFFFNNEFTIVDIGK